MNRRRYLDCGILADVDPARAKAMVDELRGKTVGGWTVKSLRGNGKSAVVFVAERGDEIAALKVFDRELVERFGRDVQLERLNRELSLRGVEHENLVRILDGGEDDSFPHPLMFVVMELVEGKTLSDVLDKVPRDRIWPLIAQVAGAARFLESHNLCHRDIKPDNIAVSPDFDHAKLLDLGVLKPFGAPKHDSVTAEDVFVGTLRYGPPEFIDREEEHNVDALRALTFYQLGAVLHDLIMQRRLFADAKPYSKLVDAVKRDAPELQADDVPPKLVLLAKNCLLKKPEVRTKYVAWESFQQPGPDIDPATEAADRVRLRMNAAGAPETTLREWQKQQDLAEAGRDALLRIDNAIRNVCTTSDILPPAKFGQSLDAASGDAFVIVRFEPTLRNQLPHDLTFCLRIHMIDPAAGVVQIDGLAVVSPEKLDLTQGCGRPMKTVYEGALEDRSVREKFQALLMNGFDAAQNTPASAGTRWLFAGEETAMTS